MKFLFKEENSNCEPCVNPIWRGEDSAISVFSEPFFESQDVIIMKNGENLLATESAEDFKGKILGCCLGYFYTEGFQEEFDKGTIIRDDSCTFENNLKKLNIGRIDGIIIDRLTSQYIIRKLGFNPDNYKVVYKFKKKIPLMFRIRKEKKYMLPPLNKALSEMKNDGTIEKIINSY